MRKDKKKIQEELKNEADLISKSVDFWGAEIEKIFVEIDKFEEQPEFQQDYKIMEGLLQKLEKLVTRGDQEREILDKFEEKFHRLWPKVLYFKNNGDQKQIVEKGGEKKQLEKSFVIKLSNSETKDDKKN